MEIAKISLSKDAVAVANADGTVSINYTPPTPPPVPTGKILWSVNHELGDLNEWSANGGGGLFPSGTATVIPVTSPAIGKFAVQMTIDTVPGVAGCRLFRWKETQDDLAQGSLGRYFSAWFYFPRAYQVGSWWQIAGWKSKHPAGNDPFFNINVSNRANGANFLQVFGWQPSLRKFYDQPAVDIPVGRWFKVEGFYKADPGTGGRVTLWQDDVLLTDIAGIQTRYSDGDYQFALNNYGQMLLPSPTTIYMDNAAISTDRVANSA